MKKISVFNRKGGTGKSSTATSLAHGLAIFGRRVLLIDCDSQASSTYWLGLETGHLTLHHLLLEEVPPEQCIVSGVRENLDMIGADETLIETDIQLVNRIGRERLLERKLKDLDGYDYVLLDCPPSFNHLSLNAMTYADELLVPISMDFLSLLGVKKILDNIAVVSKELGMDIPIGWVLPTFYDVRNKISEEVLNALREFFGERCCEPIRVSVRMKEAPNHKQSIFEYAKDSHASIDYLKLTEVIVVHEEENIRQPA